MTQSGNQISRDLSSPTLVVFRVIHYFDECDMMRLKFRRICK